MGRQSSGGGGGGVTVSGAVNRSWVSTRWFEGKGGGRSVDEVGFVAGLGCRVEAEERWMFDPGWRWISAELRGKGGVDGWGGGGGEGRCRGGGG